MSNSPVKCRVAFYYLVEALKGKPSTFFVSLKQCFHGDGFLLFTKAVLINSSGIVKIFLASHGRDIGSSRIDGK